MGIQPKASIEGGKNMVPGEYGRDIQFARQITSMQDTKFTGDQTDTPFQNLSPTNFFQAVGQLKTFGYATDSIGPCMLTARRIVEKQRDGYQICTLRILLHLKHV